MPLEPAVLGDAGAKNGMVRSHRFLGANTALPHLRGDAEQERRTLENLRGRASLALLWSGPARVDALMRARGVGHRFPGGTMDSNEVWLEVTALDAAGKVIGVSGGARARRRARRRRAPGARAAGRRARRAARAARPAAPARHGVRRGADAVRSAGGALRGAAGHGARAGAPALPQVHRAYAAFACADLPARARARCLDLPIAEIAAAELAAGAPRTDDPATLVDWGIALADATADHAEEARAPLEAARAKWPARVEPLIGLARLAFKLGQTDDVVRFAGEARARVAEHPAALALETRALLDAYRFAAARPSPERLARRLPGDRDRARRSRRAPAASPATPPGRSRPPTACWRSIPSRRRASTSARSRSPSSAAPTTPSARPRATSSTASQSRPISPCATAGGASTPATPTNPSPATPTGCKPVRYR